MLYFTIEIAKHPEGSIEAEDQHNFIKCVTIYTGS